MKTSQITDSDFIGPLPYWKDILCTEHVYSINRGDAVKGQPMRAGSAYNFKECRCQACRLAWSLKSRRYHKKNRAERLEQNRKYYQENREKLAKKSREYYHENSDRVLKRKRKYKQENSDRISEYNRKYKQSPAGKAAMRRHHLKRRSTDQDFFDSMTREEHARFYAISEYFHPVIETHVDHVIPVALGGTSHPDNLCVLTALENEIKADKHPGEWYYCTVPLLGRYRVDH